MTFGSLFAGIGGLDLGLERAGMQCRWQVEIDEYCTQVLEKHWPGVKRYGDIRKLSGDELEPVDLICGGFPCQDLSVAGKQEGIEGTRSILWFEFARLVRRLGPRWVLIENVPGLLVHGAMRRVVGELARLGYVGCWRSLRASEFRASHLRKRVFLVAYRDGERCGEAGGLRSGTFALSGSGSQDVADRERYGGHQGRTESGGQQGRSDVVECDGKLGDSQRTRWEQTGIRCDEQAGSESEAGCGDLADASNGFLPAAFRQPVERDGSGSAGEILSDSLSEGLEIRGRERGDHAAQCATPERDCRTLPAFAPGPADPRWPAILEHYPWLAPALESPVRGVADGISRDLERAMRHRTKRLGRLGNAVVPQAAQWIGEKILALEGGR